MQNPALPSPLSVPHGRSGAPAADNRTCPVIFGDGQTHRVALYLLDWDREGRSETVTVSDATSGATLSSTNVTSFGGGEYLTYDLSGHVKVTVSNDTGSLNAVVSGIFFDPIQNTAATTNRLATAAAGQQYTVSLAASGAGAAPINSWDVNWGDGTADSIQPGTTITATHTYANPGNYLVSTTALTSNNTTLQVPTNLDASFGTNGIATTDLGGNDIASAMLAQSDGGLIVVGSSNGSFALSRYNADGSPDTDFGFAGTVVTPAADGAAEAVATDSGADLLVAGYVWDASTGHQDLALACYGSDGSLDPSFGVNGIATTPFGSNAYAVGVGVQSSGEIVVAGYTAAGSAVLAAYNADGTPDLSFGTNGVVTAPSSVSSASSLALQQDDSLVLAGTGSGGPVLLRYTAAGILDSSFGSAGSVSLPSGTNAAPALAIDYSGSQSTNPNWGDILVGGSGVVRYTPDGSLDSSFGTGGTAAPLNTPFTASAIAVTNSGGIATAGSLGGAFAAAVYNPDGSVDTDFGVGGQLSFPINNSFESGASALSVRLDGTLAVAGHAWNGTSNDFAVASILPSDTLAVNIPAPTLTATAVSDQEVDLSWTSVYSGATSIQVLQSTDGTTFTPIATLDPSATSYPDTSVSDSSSYTYELLVQGDQCSTDPTQSAYTDPVTANTAAPVTDLSATAASSSEIDLTWANNDPSSTAFEIDRNTDDENWQAVATTASASTLSYHDIGIPEGRPFYYRVKAVLPSGPSNPSSEVVTSTPIATTSGPTTYWVAPGVSGTQYTQSSPGSLIALVSSLDTAPAGGNSVVNLEPGNYFLPQTLQIDGNASNVTFEAAPGSDPSNPPVITSGVNITGWESQPAYTVAASGGNPAFDVYSAPLNSADFPGTMQFRDFYLNGQRMPRARTPAAGANYKYIDSMAPDRTNGSLTINIPQADAPGSSSMSFPAFVTQQANSTNAVEIAFLAGYNETRLRIVRATPDGADYTLTIASTDAADFDAIVLQGVEHYGKDGTQPFFLENAPQFLHPGEFYEDTAGKTVYYAVRNSSDVAMLHAANEVTVPAAISDGSTLPYPISNLPVVSSPLVEIGSDATPQDPVVPEVQNVTITGIAFEYSNWIDPSSYGYVPNQDGYFVLNSSSGGLDEATVQVPAVRIENATNLNVTDDFFEHLGGAGLEIYDQSRSNTISGNTFSDISGNGIIVDGNPVDPVNGPYGAGLGYHSLAVSAGDIISGNTISTIGATFPDSSAIQASYTDTLSIKNNDIHDIPSTGISLGVLHGSGVTIPKPRSSNLRLPASYTLADVEWNNIYQFGEMLEDGGGIYVDGPNWKATAASGTNVKNNYFHDNPYSQQDGAPATVIGENGFPLALSSYAIYLETGSTGVTAVSNDTFDIRGGSGARSQNNHNTRLGARAGSNQNVLAVPVNSSTIIDQAGPSPSADLNAHLSYHKPQPSMTQTFTLPYTGTYQVAVRVAGVVGPGSAIAVSTPGVPGASIIKLAPSAAPYSLLLPLSFLATSQGSVSITVTFAGGRLASVILERLWLVPTLVNPYAS